jgi:hypothetical protein
MEEERGESMRMENFGYEEEEENSDNLLIISFPFHL